MTMTTSTATALARVPSRKILAPGWHTLLLVGAILAYALGGQNFDHRLSEHYGRLASYAWTIAVEWIVVVYVLAATRRRGIGMAELVGGRWSCWRDLLKDIAIAVAFWVGSSIVLAGMAYLLGVVGNAAALRRSLYFMIPGNAVELLGWLLMSVSAGGFCEEVIFRGYLQRQFGAWLGSDVAGVILSALVFGGAHAYEGQTRMAVLAIYGALFGSLALFRKSLRPGMMAHAWHDSLSGIVLSALRAAGK